MRLRHAHRHFYLGWTHFWAQLWKVIRNPIFLVLTLIGNIIWLVCSGLFFIFEYGNNPHVNSWFDAMWWAIITMSTVGYGDVTPHTLAGRLITIFLIFTGGVLFLSFIALLSSAFLELEFVELEREVRALRRKIVSVSDHNNHSDEQNKGDD